MKPYIRSVGIVVRYNLVMKLTDLSETSMAPIRATDCEEFVIAYSSKLLESRIKSAWNRTGKGGKLLTDDQKRRRFVEGDKKTLNLHKTFHIYDQYPTPRSNHPSAVRSNIVLG